MARDYAAAIEALNTLQTNASIIEAIRKSGGSRNQYAISEMIGWCRRLGYEPEDFNKLNIIHIAGTKGKGSTSAFISSILQQYIPSPQHNNPITSSSDSQASQLSCFPTAIGLYTSPHLRSVRERIRINGTPLSEATFSRFFFETWDRLEASYDRDEASTTTTATPAKADPATDGATPTSENPRPKPVYFRYLTLMALHTYFSLSQTQRNPPDQTPQTSHMALVLETGVGGSHDSTNIVPSPLVTAITPLALDHTQILGNTLASIAHHKSGIFKTGSPHDTVYTTPQPLEAMAVLEQRAEEAGKNLCVVNVHPEIERGEVKLGLEGSFQRINASLAVACAAAWLRQRGCEGPTIPRSGSSDPLPDEFRRGLETTKWGGRCEVRADPVIGDGRLMWYLDGGHTVESVRLAGEWFASHAAANHPTTGSSSSTATSSADPNGTGRQQPPSMTTSPTSKPKQRRRILLFNQQTRDAPALARSLHAVLSTSLSSNPTNSAPNSPTETTIKTKEPPLFTTAIFSTNVTYAPSSSSSSSATQPSAPGTSAPTPAKQTNYKPDLLSLSTPSTSISTLSVQKSLAQVWTQLERDAGRGNVGGGVGGGGEEEAAAAAAGTEGRENQGEEGVDVDTRVVGSIGEAVELVRALVVSGTQRGERQGGGGVGEREAIDVDDANNDDGQETAVFVTGSLHLVGGVLEVLGAGDEAEDSEG